MSGSGHIPKGQHNINPYSYETGQLHPPHPKWYEQYRLWPDIGEQYKEQAQTYGLFQDEEALPIDELNFCGTHGIFFEKKIGTGHFSTVWLVNKINLDTGEPTQYACKVLNLRTFGDPGGIFFFDNRARRSLWTAVPLMITEAEVLQVLSHENLMRMHHVFNLHDQITGFPYVRLLLFLDLCDGDLTSFIENSPEGQLTEDVLKDMMKQVSAGLRYMHEEHDICHFDIKPANIMYITQPDEDRTIFKLGDFGLAMQFDPEEVEHKGVGCSIFYRAPEMSNTEPYAPKPTDVFSLGVSFGEALLGSIMGLSYTNHSCIDWIQKKWETERDQIVEYYSVTVDCIDLLRIMTTTEPRDRATIGEVCTHQWFATQQQDYHAHGQGQQAFDQGQGAIEDGQEAIDQGQGTDDLEQGFDQLNLEDAHDQQ